MRVAILVAVLCSLAASPAHSLVIDITSSDGAPGTDGGAAMASALSADDYNLAAATAGAGGPGPSDGVPPGDGGSAEATAETAVTGTATAITSAHGGAGGAASAGTTGGAGGDAAANAVAESQTDFADASSQASAGAGLEGGAGGTASASAISRNLGSESVVAAATAVGADGGDLSSTTNAARGGNGGEARLGTVHGSSFGGYVIVSGAAVGGSGGAGDPVSGRPSGDGASVHLDNAVTGETAGILHLEQFAQGGRAGETAGGVHGDTSSRLAVSKTSAGIEAFSVALGAFDAESSVSVENSGGPVLVSSQAYGGDGRVADQETPERGGDARVEAIGTSAGDGHEVIVVAQDPQNAQGGRGAAAGAAAVNEAGRGGDAISRSVGQALGDSPVTVEDRAVGGNGGTGYGPGGVLAGIGGSAFSSATGVSQGASPVSVSSHATGGRGGLFDSVMTTTPLPTARSGDASATAVARGLGEVDAQATALVGQFQGFAFPWQASESGEARASATAEGTSGEARAEALASGLDLASLNVSTSVPVLSRATAEARSAIGDPFLRMPLGSVDAFANAGGSPSDPDVQAAIQGNPQVSDAFQGEAIDIVFSLGQVGFARLQEADGAATTQHAALELIPSVLSVSVLQHVLVGFVNPGFLGPGFDSLRFQARHRDETLVDVSFDGLDEALSYFDDRVLDLGNSTQCIPGGFGRRGFCLASQLELLFDWTGSEQGAGFGVDLIVGLTPVPEPSTALLLAFGLAVIAARARRRHALI